MRGLGLGLGLELERRRSGIVVPSSPSPLLTDLVAYWKLDETSGNRLDSHGSNTLTDNGSVGSTTGKQGNAVDIDGATATLSVASNSALQLPGDWTISVWVYPHVVDAAIAGEVPYFPYVLGKDDNTDRNYAIRFFDTLDASPTIEAAVGTSSGFQRLAWSASVSANTWYHIVTWYVSATTTLYLSVNNGTPVSTVLTGTLTVGNASLIFGKRGDSTSGSLYDGLVDEPGIWKRVLSSNERTALYNSGVGVTYPFT